MVKNPENAGYMPDGKICRTVSGIFPENFYAFYRPVRTIYPIFSRKFTVRLSGNRPPDGCRTVDIRTVAGHHPAEFDPKYQKITVRRIKSLNFCKKFTVRRTKTRFFDPKNATFYRPQDDFRLFYEIL